MFKKRIVASLISLFTLGVVFAVFFRNYDTIFFRALFAIMAMISVSFAIVSRFYKGISLPKNTMAVALAVAAFTFGVMRVSLFNIVSGEKHAYNGKSDSIVASVSEVNNGSLDVSVEESEIGMVKGTKVRIYSDSDTSEIRIGDKITAEVRYKSTYDSDLYSEKIMLTSSARISSVVAGEGILYRIRNTVSDNSATIFSDFIYAPSISKAVTAGDRTDLDSYIYATFRSGGVSHILAISGLHITLIVMTFYRLLLFLLRRRKPSAIISLLLAFFYTALVGFTAGAVRAAIMIAFLLVSEMTFVRSDGITTLSIALFFLLFFNPYAICSVGLQLSFLCTLGIILVTPYINTLESIAADKRKEPRRVVRILTRTGISLLIPAIISFSSSVFSLPVIFTRFDTVSYISPITNILLVPFFSYAIGISIIAVIVSLISIPVSTIIAYPAGIIFDASTFLNGILYEYDIGVVSVRSPFMILPLVASVLMIAVLVFKINKRRNYFILTSVFFVVAMSISCVFAEIYYSGVTVFEYGSENGEYVYFKSSEENIYIDVSGYLPDSDIVFEQGDVSLDTYVITKYDEYTLKRFDYMSGYLMIHEIYVKKPQNIFEMEAYLQIKELANTRNCDIIQYESIYSKEISDNSAVYMIGDGVGASHLIGIDHNGTSIAVVCGDYPYAISADYIVLTDTYTESEYMLNSKESFIKQSVAEKYSGNYIGFTQYINTVRFVGRVDESDFVAYES